MNQPTPLSKRILQRLTYWRFAIQVRWVIFCMGREVYHIRHMPPQVALARVKEMKEMLDKQPDSELVQTLRKMVDNLEKYSQVRAEKERQWWDSLPWEEITAFILTVGAVALIAAAYFWFHHLPR